MRAVDTNVLVRLLVNDEPLQAALAEQAMSSGPVFIPKTVVVELEWVLRTAYRLSPAAIAAAIESLLATADVSLEDAPAVRQSIDWFKKGLDFADALHLASSVHAESFLTFDAALRRRSAMLGARPPTVTP